MIEGRFQQEVPASSLLAGLIPQSSVKIYPDAAHGFLFQHAAEFAADIDAFLGEERGQIR